MTNIFILKSDDGTPLKLDHASDIHPHLTALANVPDVEEIRLSGNTLGVEACKALADILKTKTNLKVFNAADIFTGRLISEIPEALTALLTALLSLPLLHTVDLSDNAFGGRLAEHLKDFYSQAGPLRHLLLNNNGLGPTGGTIVANSIQELAAVKAGNPLFPPLETITCGRNRLENGSMDAWASACAAHKDLKNVNLVQNGIRPEGIERLLRDGLSQCTGLHHLDLQDNTFTVTGAQALADVVPGWPKIKVLCVSDCLLSARGGILLGEAFLLKRNCHLSKLGLQYNEINVKAARVILAALRVALPKLKILELNGNRFSEDNPVIEQFRQLFLKRGFEGLDSLSDLEEESDSEEDVVDAKFMDQEKNEIGDNLADMLGTIKIA